jgi:hypothetical protein
LLIELKVDQSIQKEDIDLLYSKAEIEECEKY